MPDPWDIPPRAEEGDPSDEAICKWIGRSLCAWEEYEVYLARLYAIFSGLPMHGGDTYKAYIAGQTLNFSGRLQKVEKAGNEYFLRFPNQQDEADFSSILKQSRGFSARRNDVAHSVLVPGLTDWDASKRDFEEWLREKHEEWWLVPPEYMQKKYSPGMRPTFSYVSADLRAFYDAFHSLILPVNELAYRLYQRHGG